MAAKNTGAELLECARAATRGTNVKHPDSALEPIALAWARGELSIRAVASAVCPGGPNALSGNPYGALARGLRAYVQRMDAKK